MEIDKDKLLACWQKWNIHKSAFTPSVRLIKERRFEFDRERYGYEIYDIQKADETSIYDFTSECLYIVNGENIG